MRVGPQSPSRWPSRHAAPVILLEALTLVPPYSQESLEAVNLAEDPDIFTVMHCKERLQELQFQAEKVELNKPAERRRLHVP
jgi:hypothetical protein